MADVLGGQQPWTGLARVVAAVACLGSLIGILAGLSRTGLAMARERDLSGPLSRISARTHAPVLAEATVGVAAIAGILLLDPARLVGFSACSVLVYYAIAHLSALRQRPADRPGGPVRGRGRMPAAGAHPPVPGRAGGGGLAGRRADRARHPPGTGRPPPLTPAPTPAGLASPLLLAPRPRQRRLLPGRTTVARPDDCCRCALSVSLW
jgi:hypothetical protein